MEWAFRVQLTNVSVKNLHCPDRPRGSGPYVRCDFDGKTLQTDVCGTPAGDPSWPAFRSSFEYRLVEDDLSRAVASLGARMASFEVRYTNGTDEVIAGRASVDLFSIAAGSSHLQLALTNPMQTAASTPTAVGALHCTLSVEQLCISTVTLSMCSIHGLPQPTQTQLVCELKGPDVDAKTTRGASLVAESRVSAATSNPTFDHGPRLSVRLSLRALMESTLVVRVRDVVSGNLSMGSVDLPLKEFLESTTDHSSKFKRNLYGDPSYPRPFTAHVTGVLSFSDLPRLAQLATGLNNNGNIHGRPILESCLLPPRHTKFPARLPDYERSAPLPTPALRPDSYAYEASRLAGATPIPETDLSGPTHRLAGHQCYTRCARALPLGFRYLRIALRRR